MSFQAMAEAIKIKTGDPAANHLLLIIANYANDEWKAWPTQERLAADMEMSVRSVRAKIDWLVQQGYLHVETFRQGESTRNMYVFHPANSAASEFPPGKFCNSTRQNTTFHPANSAGKPIIEPIKEPITVFFERLMKVYPKREGRNPAEPAEREFEALVKSGIDPEQIIRAATSYAEEVKQSKMDRRFVVQTHRWLNECHWRETAAVETKVETVEIVEGDDRWLELVERGKKPGMLRSLLKPSQMGKGQVLIWPAADFHSPSIQ